MNEGIQAAVLFLIVFAACMTCYKIGSMDGRDAERRMRIRIRATQHDLRQERANNR